jgi:hypothetical protein
MASKKTKTNQASAVDGAAVPENGASRPSKKAKKPAQRKTKDTATPGKLSALDAAAKVLEESGQPMNCQALIQDMAAKGYWTSPAGKTPASTLYSALLREIKLKGEQGRFQKSARGLFAYQAPQAS